MVAAEGLLSDFQTSLAHFERSRVVAGGLHPVDFGAFEDANTAGVMHEQAVCHGGAAVPDVRQLIAAALSYGLGLTLFLLSMRSLVAIPTRSREAEIFAHISMTEHMQDFARGVIEVSSVIYYPTFTLFFLFLTWKVIESRRWK